MCIHTLTHTHILGSKETRKENNGHKKQKVNAKYWGIGQLRATRKKKIAYLEKIFPGQYANVT